MTKHDDQAFLGRGWAFPVQTTADGRVMMTAYEEDIRQSIRIILGTAHGERAMRPTFGAGLEPLVFEPLNTATLALIRHRVQQALIEWEPRIDSVTVNVSAVPDQGRVDIDLSYRVRKTNTFYNLVYPFYLLEGEEQ